MTNYLINDLNLSGYNNIITLLDYKEKISACLKNIKQLPLPGGKVLVDTALVSGLNSYRFIEVKIDQDGTLDLNQYAYVMVNDAIIDKANSIINTEPAWLNNSILTNSQKKLIATS
ncbi:type II toxin-antitoxin system RnlB family antitoxin [Mediannikoviicoccus vaginalis]|uniref:type II toxin-antitoxin system RnlB family antitoxin n=1 Tax=Mediannikoviicoccus vaginalis TaxID=2899727 RepID=UPI001F1C1BE1|nr:type II toxin-antitoxin system RnlB family antitoxin [Mediannikoviicoccus vaginalis]